MAVPTISISGSVLTPSGDAPTSGRFTIKLSTAGSVTDPDTGSVVRVATEETVDLTAGAIAVSLVPNESITPTGTYYLVSAICVMPSGRRIQWSEKWQLAASPVTLDIGSVPRTDIQAGVAASHVGDWPAQAAAQVAAAAASAASAAVDAAAAGSWASSAEASAGAAAVSAAAASSISGIYADTTAGLAATSSGSYFYTVSTDPYVLILYLDNAGVAVEQGRVPAATAVQALQRALTPEATDTDSNLLYICDSAGRVIAYWDSTSGLQLTGRYGESVQTKLTHLDGITSQTTPTDLLAVVDAAGNAVARIDSAAGLRLAGMSEPAQTVANRSEQLADLLYRPTGQTVLPYDFTVMGKALRGEERYIWSSMPRELRPNNNTITAYPFEWDSADQVVPSMMCRRVGTLAPGSWDQIIWGAEEAITVSPSSYYDPGVYPTGGRQFRDGATMFDRATGLYWFCISGITGTADGWKCDNVPIFSSSDGLAWTHVYNIPVPSYYVTSPSEVTPDWFVDSDGTLYITVCGNSAVELRKNLLFLRCDNTTTMTSWTEMGFISGSAIPYITATGLKSIIDSCIFTRQGVYYLLWRAEMYGGIGNEEHGQMGIAWSSSMLGPYDSGHRFLAPSGERMKGEGLCMVELPAGHRRRYRLFWDNYLGTTYGGIGGVCHMFADTDDFGPTTAAFTAPQLTGFPTGSTGKDRNTAFIIGYP